MILFGGVNPYDEAYKDIEALKEVTDDFMILHSKNMWPASSSTVKESYKALTVFEALLVMYFYQ